jgi:Tfp pilus assembly protein PilV
MRSLRSKAFTLVEVLGSMVILAGAIVGVILCNADGLAASKNIEQKVKSTLLAESEIEQIKGSLAQDFDQIYNDNHVNLGADYLSKNSVKNISGRPGLRLVRVSVGYDTNSSGDLASSEIMFTLLTQVAE